MDMRFIYQSRKYRGNVFMRVFRLEPDLARSLFTSLEAPNPTFTHHQQDCRIKTQQPWRKSLFRQSIGIPSYCKLNTVC